MSFFFFNDTATTEFYTLSLHDALPISNRTRTAPESRPAPANCDGSRIACTAPSGGTAVSPANSAWTVKLRRDEGVDRKSTRLNSSHDQISYAVFCLKKKKTKSTHIASC